MQRMLILLGAVALCVVGAVLVLMRGDDPVLVGTVVAHPIEGSTSVMVTAEFANPGPPDRLMDVRSDVAKLSVLKSPRTHGLPLPSGSTPSLAMEAGHIMLMSVTGDVAEGARIPLTLLFERSGEMPVLADVTQMTMQHGTMLEVDAGGAPSVDVSVAPDGVRWIVNIETQNFRFAPEQVDAPHEAGTGHAHLYVEGMKIGRVFSGIVTLGELPSGTHEVLVTLNTNDHRTYSVGGVPIEARVFISVE